MKPVEKELKVLLIEVDQTLSEMQDKITSYEYQKSKDGVDFFSKAVEMRAQLLRGYAFKAEIISKLNNI